MAERAGAPTRWLWALVVGLSGGLALLNPAGRRIGSATQRPEHRAEASPVVVERVARA